jgi:putative flippase GtrA
MHQIAQCLLKYFSASQDNKGISFNKFQSFLLISGIGWLGAMSILGLMVNAFGFSPFFGNALGDFAAVSFVFFVSAKWTFVHRRRFMWFKFSVFVIYQFFLIIFISSLIQFGSSYEVFSRVAWYQATKELVIKGLLTPFTLLANFLFGYFILEKIME